jgi:hypothetical protein
MKIDIPFRPNSSRGHLSHALLLLALLLGGCAGHSDYMASVPAENAHYAPKPDKAMIVFMRPSGLGFAVQSSVFDVTSGTPEFIAIVPAKKKVAHEVAPGKYRFMVIGENADFMDADLAAGKTYYAVVAPGMGMWKARFYFEPVKTAGASSDLAGWLADCEWVENTPQALDWSRGAMASVQGKKSDYLPDWMKATDKSVLAAADGL